ncbi:unnamed protein product, partial [Durusdinium trenchii]
MTKCLVLRPQRGTKHGERQPGARCALFTLSCINALNFADRYVPAAVKTSMEKDLQINDWQSALPSMAMTAVFTVASLIFGFLADREILDRRCRARTLRTEQRASLLGARALLVTRIRIKFKVRMSFSIFLPLLDRIILASG